MRAYFSRFITQNLQWLVRSWSDFVLSFPLTHSSNTERHSLWSPIENIGKNLLSLTEPNVAKTLPFNSNSVDNVNIVYVLPTKIFNIPLP